MTHLYHLSHIDLDGYGCQYLTQKAYEQIRCYNANYGPEVTARLQEIIDQIKRDRYLGKDPDERLILITDLNLTTKEANWIEKEAMGVGAKLQLLDHHATGEKAAERFAWYYLDTTRSATRITYDWLREHRGFDPEGTYLPIVETINAIDIWLSNDPRFEYGKVGLGMISGAREINRVLFPDEDRAFKLSLIEAAHRRADAPDAPILLDDDLHGVKKSFFREERNDTKDNLVADYITRLLTRDKGRMTIHYGDAKGILTYQAGNTSLIGNAFLQANPDYAFYMDVNSRGNFSLRSADRIDVAQMAAQIGNGGGHPNAAGGKIKDYKDSFVYSEIKAFIQNYLDERRGGESEEEAK
jgi:oligoribonuclease NrnB/cAMP/cGMP phosphodiesterase (DHH superfamily)